MCYYLKNYSINRDNVIKFLPKTMEVPDICDILDHKIVIKFTYT